MSSIAVSSFIAALNRAGAFQRFQWTTAAKPAAAHKGRELAKVTVATVRTGVEYKNLAENLDRETGALPWGTWLTYPYIVTHRDTLYGRIYVNKRSLKSTYYVDGTEVDRATWLSFQPPSAAKSRPATDSDTLTLTVKLANITAL